MGSTVVEGEERVLRTEARLVHVATDAKQLAMFRSRFDADMKRLYNDIATRVRAIDASSTPEAADNVQALVSMHGSMEYYMTSVGYKPNNKTYEHCTIPTT